jgi:hypothetical protein
MESMNKFEERQFEAAPEEGAKDVSEKREVKGSAAKRVGRVLGLVGALGAAGAATESNAFSQDAKAVTRTVEGKLANESNRQFFIREMRTEFITIFSKKRTPEEREKSMDFLRNMMENRGVSLDDLFKLGREKAPGEKEGTEQLYRGMPFQDELKAAVWFKVSGEKLYVFVLSDTGRKYLAENFDNDPDIRHFMDNYYGKVRTSSGLLAGGEGLNITLDNIFSGLPGKERSAMVVSTEITNDTKSDLPKYIKGLEVKTRK